MSIQPTEASGNIDPQQLLHTQKEEVKKTEEKKNETTTESTAQKAETVATQVVAQKQAAKKALPEVKLVKISRKDLKNLDRNLVKKHVPSRIEDIKWDPARKVVVIVKSGKERAYKIGRGAAPALFESKKHEDIVNFLKKM